MKITTSIVATVISLTVANASQLNHQIKSSKNALTLESMQNLQVTKQSADFVQTSVRLDSQSQRAVLGVGVGKRFVIGKYSTAGFNLFTDYETKSKHRQASFGLEYMRHNFKANFNKYFTLSSAK
ncbi:inverse autotransporter beta domain-containing protein, partial [bacterium endosymbiont of Bathymodiolus sp. 5 South]|uniref:inverse autotransporter beta domain-containing protein n=1 Tax=bacterium endosymbiont of Bathymodiolus sp. 5 South TaxID=1181670 RepID=UPI001117B25D